MRESVLYLTNQLLFFNVTYFACSVCVCVFVCVGARTQVHT